MANVVTANPLIIDTAGAGNILSRELKINEIRWVGATTAGHSAVVRDKADRITWESVADAANYVEESHFFTITGEREFVQEGLRVTALGSGKLYIYIDSPIPPS